MYKAPNLKPLSKKLKFSVFLAGSIEQGTAEDWQTKLFESIKDFDIDVFNPRRDEWDSSLKQDISDPVFREQVEWELSHLDKVDFVVVYFDPATMSPVTLLELGIMCEQFSLADAHAQKALFVCCPDGFWRKGNVQIVCNKYGIKLYETFGDLASALSTQLERLKIK